MSKVSLSCGTPWAAMSEPCLGEMSRGGKGGWVERLSDLYACLHAVVATTQQRDVLTPDAAFQRWQDATECVRKADGSVYLIGNGASASMASHFATDISKNARIRAHVFTDLSQVTAIGNDVSFDQIYAIPLKRSARAGDMLVAISSSGKSPNILAAVEVAHACHVYVVTLSGFAEKNPLRACGDLNFYVPAHSYGLAETSHAAILHHWMDALEG